MSVREKEQPWSYVDCPECDYRSRDYHDDDKAKRVCQNHDDKFHDGEGTSFVVTNHPGDTFECLQ